MFVITQGFGSPSLVTQGFGSSPPVVATCYGGPRLVCGPGLMPMLLVAVESGPPVPTRVEGTLVGGVRGIIAPREVCGELVGGICSTLVQT